MIDFTCTAFESAEEMTDDEFLAWMEGYSEDHEPDGWPAVRMRDITRLVEIARRLKVAHLRRMVHATSLVELRALRRTYCKSVRPHSVRAEEVVGRMDRFRDACNSEIARLRENS